MATDKRGRKLPKGIRQRSNSTFEGRFTYQGESYCVHANTIGETQKAMNENISLNMVSLPLLIILLLVRGLIHGCSSIRKIKLKWGHIGVMMNIIRWQ